MVNNFEFIAEILRTKNMGEMDIIMVQTIRRRKENPEQESNNRTINTRYIKSPEDLLKKQDEIIAECTAHNARAYITLNLRDKKRVALEALALMARIVANGQYDVHNVYDSAAGSNNADPNRTWVIDIDYPADLTLQWMEEYEQMKAEILELVRETGRPVFSWTIPTKNGRHLIVPPFNLKKFKDKYPKVDVHKDNPTILYIP